MSADRDQLAAALVGEGWDGEDALDLAVTLLPVVDRIANERAAAELEAAGHAIQREGFGAHDDVAWIPLRRAAALRASNGEVA